MLSDEDIVKNYNLYVTLLKELGPERFENIEKMIDHLGTRLATAPASSKLEYHGAYPGGLVDHSLRVLKVAKKLLKAYSFDIPIDSLIVSALFHDLGKVGTRDEDFYVPEESSWHREKLGKMYSLNKKIPKIPNAELGLWLLQSFNISLTLDEWIAIRINDGAYSEANSYYKMGEPKLALIIQQADRIACEMEKDLYESTLQKDSWKIKWINS